MLSKRLINFPSNPYTWAHPFTAMDTMTRMARQMDQLSDALLGRRGARWPSAGLFPVLNLTEDHERYYVRAQLPGVKAEALELQLNGRKLVLAGERSLDVEDDQARYHRRERRGGKFTRVIELPGDVDADQIDAAMRDGILMVTIPKAEASKPKQITVH
jgi:HSP20 family protein